MPFSLVVIFWSYMTVKFVMQGYNSKYATRERHLQSMEAKHVMDSNPEKLMDNLNEKMSSWNELKLDGWKPLDEEQQPTEVQKFTR